MRVFREALPMRMDRLSGLLLHPTSPPGRYGIGDLGPSAIGFIERLAEARQRIWQVLPLGPTGFGDSPYAPFSSFAGNELLISLDLLAEEGLLDRRELGRIPVFPSTKSTTVRSFIGSADSSTARPRHLSPELRKSVARISRSSGPGRGMAFALFPFQGAQGRI